MRLQLALNVADLDAAIAWYGAALGAALQQREPGYASFVLDEPALKLVLFEAPDATERLNHVGFEVMDDEQVVTAGDRLEAAGLLTERETEEICCYARQNKAIAHDPQGLMWEWYRVLEDTKGFFSEQPPAEPAAESATAEPAGRCC